MIKKNIKSLNAHTCCLCLCQDNIYTQCKIRCFTYLIYSLILKEIEV